MEHFECVRRGGARLPNAIELKNRDDVGDSSIRLPTKLEDPDPLEA